MLSYGFNGHPPLGVNATGQNASLGKVGVLFQWAPTLGGECYKVISMNNGFDLLKVSMGTHPWG